MRVAHTQSICKLQSMYVTSEYMVFGAVNPHYNMYNINRYYKQHCNEENRTYLSRASHPISVPERRALLDLVNIV